MTPRLPSGYVEMELDRFRVGDLVLSVSGWRRIEAIQRDYALTIHVDSSGHELPLPLRWPTMRTLRTARSTAKRDKLVASEPKAPRLLRTAIGAELRKRRLEANMTQAAVAEKMGMLRPLVARIEHGRHMQSIPVVLRYCRAIGVSIGDVLNVAVATVASDSE